MIRTSGIVFGIISLLIVLVAAITTIIVSKVFNLSPALSIGLMTSGLEVNTNLQNVDHIKLQRVVVDSDEIIGNSIKELGIRRLFGVTVTRIENEVVLNIAKMLECGWKVATYLPL